MAEFLRGKKGGRFEVAKTWPLFYERKWVGRFEVAKGGRILTRDRGFEVARRWPNFDEGKEVVLKSPEGGQSLTRGNKGVVLGSPKDGENPMSVKGWVVLRSRKVAEILRG